jgi:hypothetical protein
MLAGDLLAYIDIFAVLFLLGILSRAATVVFIVKQATAHAGSLVSSLLDGMRRLNFRHRREGGAKHQKRSTNRAPDNNDERFVTHGVAWA